MVFNPSLPREDITLLACNWLFFKTAFCDSGDQKLKLIIIIEPEGQLRLKDSSAAGKEKEDFPVNPVMVSEMKACLLKEAFTCLHCRKAFIPRGEGNRAHFLTASGLRHHQASPGCFSTACAKWLELLLVSCCTGIGKDLPSLERGLMCFILLVLLSQFLRLRANTLYFLISLCSALSSQNYATSVKHLVLKPAYSNTPLIEYLSVEFTLKFLSSVLSQCTGTKLY